MGAKQDRNYNILFGKNLRKIRKSKGLSMEMLSYAAEMEYSQISRIELGKINTTISTLKQLADALEVEPKELLDFQSDDQQSEH